MTIPAAWAELASHGMIADGHIDEPHYGIGRVPDHAVVLIEDCGTDMLDARLWAPCMATDVVVGMRGRLPTRVLVGMCFAYHRERCGCDLTADLERRYGWAAPAPE